MHSPTNFKVTYLDIEDKKIPDNFKGIRILFFSDLCYGNIFNQQYLEKLQKTLSTIDYDIVIYGGDLFDSQYSAVSDDVDLLTEFFSNFDSNLGNFYLLSENDQATDTRAVLVKKIMTDANFELVDKTLKLYHGLSGYITLSNGNQPLELDSSTYNLVVHSSLQFYNRNIDNADWNIYCNVSHLNTDLFHNDRSLLGLNGNKYVVSSVGLMEPYRLFNNPEILLLRY